MSTPTSNALSPEQAAILSGRSRRTIMRAIKLLEIKAVRNNKNHWLLDRDSVILWMSKDAPDGRAQPNAHQDAHPEQSEELRSLRRENADLRSRVEAAERDRDAWRDQAKRDQAALHEAAKRRWWRW